MVKEQQWQINTQAAGYEAVHLSMLSGLLGNIGFKGEESEAYLGAHGIKFHPHPGAHLSKKPGALDCGRRAGGNLAPVWPGHCGD